MLRSASALALLAVLFFTMGVALQAQNALTPKGVPQTGGLRGVEVSQHKGRGTEDDPVIMNAPVIIASLEDGSPAQQAGLRRGDKLITVQLSRSNGRGPVGRLQTTDDFYGLAANCVPDCLVRYQRGSTAPVLKGVGALGTNFSAVIEPGNRRGYVDNVTKLFYPQVGGVQPYSQVSGPAQYPQGSGRGIAGSQPRTVIPSNDIAGEIQTIRQGNHAAMPTAQAAPANLGGQTGWIVENGTACNLTVLLSGPISQRMDLVAGTSQTLRVSPGSYEVAASVSCPNVIPFYGNLNLGANTQYSERFYIGSR
jgi:hypothetical protein